MGKELTKNQRYEKKRKDAGLKKVTVWCPDYATDELKELMNNICEIYLEKGEFHQDLIPSMYRNIHTGVMGNKSLHDIKRKAGRLL